MIMNKIDNMVAKDKNLKLSILFLINKGEFNKSKVPKNITLDIITLGIVSSNSKVSSSIKSSFFKISN